MAGCKRSSGLMHTLFAPENHMKCMFGKTANKEMPVLLECLAKTYGPKK